MTSKRAGPAVEIDNLAQRQAPVAPSRVDVKIAEQKRFVSWHQDRLRQAARRRRG